MGNFIEERVRELFYGGGTEYDFSPWIQFNYSTEEEKQIEDL